MDDEASSSGHPGPRTAFGVYLKTLTPEFIPIVQAVGLDFIRIDLQHGLDRPGDAEELITAARKVGVGVGARLPHNRDLVATVLAMGVDSVTFPGVNTAGQARELVQWCRSADVVLSVQIETTQGLTNVIDIASVDGVDVLHCGRSDLARALGTAGHVKRKATVDAAEDVVLAAAASAGKRSAVHWPPGNDDLGRVRRLVADGIAWVTLGADTQIFRAALAHRLSQANHLVPATTG